MFRFFTHALTHQQEFSNSSYLFCRPVSVSFFLSSYLSSLPFFLSSLLALKTFLGLLSSLIWTHFFLLLFFSKLIPFFRSSTHASYSSFLVIYSFFLCSPPHIFYLFSFSLLTFLSSSSGVILYLYYTCCSLGVILHCHSFSYTLSLALFPHFCLHPPLNHTRKKESRLRR